MNPTDTNIGTPLSAARCRGGRGNRLKASAGRGRGATQGEAVLEDYLEGGHDLPLVVVAQPGLDVPDALVDGLGSAMRLRAVRSSRVW